MRAETRLFGALSRRSDPLELERAQRTLAYSLVDRGDG
jgi:hypothetical protein